MISKAPFLFLALPATAIIGVVASLIAIGPLTASDAAFAVRIEAPAPPAQMALASLGARAAAPVGRTE